MQDAAGLEAAGDQGHGLGLQQPALVVAGLGPRIREEHPHGGQSARRDHVFQHIDAVTADESHIRQAGPVDAAEQLGQALAVDLDRDDVQVWFLLRHGQRRDAGAAADLQHDGGGAAEPGGGVDQRGGFAVVGTGDFAQLRPAPVPGALLLGGQARPAGPEAGDAPVLVGGRGGGFGCGLVFGRRGAGRRGSVVLALGIHPSIVSHSAVRARIVVQIDTQQLPGKRRRPDPCRGATMASGGTWCRGIFGSGSRPSCSG